MVRNSGGLDVTKCFKGELADTEEKVIAILDRAKRRRMSQ